VVVNQGVLADRYAWKIEMKLGLSYQGASSQSTPQALVAEVLVVRMPTHEVPRGLAVHQLITRGRSVACSADWAWSCPEWKSASQRRRLRWG